MVLNFNSPLSKSGDFLRETALNEALTDNDSEIKRWQKYKNENETAIENLDRFVKHLRVEVMVPIGRKAMIPGELIHTNEVLVSHFQGYFSKCSSNKAKEICQLRLKSADEQLTKLDKAANLWQNKLDKPYLEGALPTGEQHDLIEEITEAEHDEWMARHKLMVHKWKQEEKAERERTSENIHTVEEEALLAELGDDLQKLDITEVNEDVLRKLLKSEKETSSSFSDDQGVNSVNDQNDKDIFEMLENRVKIEEENQELEILKVDNSANDIVLNMMGAKTVEPTEKVRIAHFRKETKGKTNLFNPMHLAKGNEQTIEESAKEVALIREEAKFLPIEDQIVFYEFQIKIVKEKSKNLTKSIPYYNEEKLRLLNLIVSLTEDLEALLDQIDLNDCSETEDSALEEPTPNVEVTPDTIKSNNREKKKRRISFALSEKTLEFRCNETVAQMLPKLNESKSPTKRDVITFNNTANILIENANNLKNQEIVDAAEKRDKTLKIVFKHSLQKPSIDVRSEETIKAVDEISTPADFYPLFLEAKTHSMDNESNNDYEREVKTPMLSEAGHREAFEDQRLIYSRSDGSKTGGTVTDMPKKSILRNKSAVESELRNSNNYQKTKANKTQSRRSQSIENEADGMSAYHKVMNEVTEKVLNAPDPLPMGKNIDANMPKKRVSHFKQQRGGNKES